jgi:PAS domain S-box-containing protein
MLLKSKNIVLVFFISLFVSTFLSANNIEKKNILLLHSYHSGMTWIDNINKAVKDTLSPDSSNYVVYTEYMDTKRHNSPEYYDALKEIYIKKYKNIKFDIILSSDNNAFDFLVKNRDDIFGKVPVSFSGVNGFETEMIKDVTMFTGVAEQFSDKETVETILKLDPKIKNIYIINDYLATGKAWTKDMKNNLKSYENRVNIIYADNLTLKELKEKINSFDKNTAILLGVYFADKDKNYITYEKIGSYLLEGSQASVYCLLNFNISNNVIGGKVITGYSQGEAMSKVALRILQGENPDTINITYSEANEFIFNYKGLKYYDINQKLVPKNSKIINKPFSLYEEYKSILFNLVTIFGIILVLLFILFLYLRTKSNSEDIQRDNFIISLIRFAPIVIIPIVTILIIWLFVYSINTNHEEMKQIEKEAYLENKKQESQREVTRYIEIAKSRLSSVDNDNLDLIKRNFIDIAKDIKYGKSGYIIVGSMEGYMLSHPNKNLVGAYVFDGKHEKTKEVFIKFKEKIEKDGSGFVSYTWINPNSKIEEKKITYVNFLPQFNWFVASGVYLDEVDQYIEKKIKKNAVFDEKNISLLIVASVVLLIFSLIISIVISIIIKNAFKNYRQSVVDEIKKSKIIEKSKKEFETIFKYAQDGIAITDLKGNFLKFNNAFKTLVEYEDDELLTKNCNALTALKDREKNSNAMQQAIITGHVDNFEKECITKNGKKVTVHISISLLPDKESFLLITKDASSIKLIEEQSKLVSMGEMIGNIAHQWRQPLSVISTGATGMKVQKEFGVLTDESFDKTCDVINENAQYLSKTIDDFRNFIKGDRKKELFDFSDNINSFLSLVDGSVKAHNIHVVLELEKNLKLDGYENELIQCYLNIFNNSKDAYKNNNIKYFFIKSYRRNNTLVVKLKDNAGGIQENIISKIFEPYFTTKHKSQGTGLGLHMTYNLISKGMNGTIEVNNISYKYKEKDYVGAEFKIILPLN